MCVRERNRQTETERNRERQRQTERQRKRQVVPPRHIPNIDTYPHLESTKVINSARQTRDATET